MPIKIRERAGERASDTAPQRQRRVNYVRSTGPLARFERCKWEQVCEPAERSSSEPSVFEGAEQQDGQEEAAANHTPETLYPWRRRRRRRFERASSLCADAQQTCQRRSLTRIDVVWPQLIASASSAPLHQNSIEPMECKKGAARRSGARLLSRGRNMKSACALAPPPGDSIYLYVFLLLLISLAPAGLLPLLAGRNQKFACQVAEGGAEGDSLGGQD